MRGTGIGMRWLVMCLATAGCLEPDSRWPPLEFQVVPESELTVIAPDVDLIDVREIVLDDGALWVLDTGPPFLTRIPHDGDQAIRFGERGQGPQELSWPVAAQPDGAGGIRVWDRGSGRVLTFDDAGMLTSSEALDPLWAPQTRRNIAEVTYADPLRIRALGGQIVTGFFPQGVNRTSDVARGSLQRANSALDPQLSLVRFADATDLSSDNMREFAAVPVWDACDGRVVYWNPKEARVSWIDQDKASGASVELTLPATDLELSDVEAYLEAMARLELGPGRRQHDVDITAMARANRDRFASTTPTVVDIRCESEDSTSLQLFDTTTDPLGHGSRWLQIHSGGAVVGLEFPTSFQPKGFTGAGIYGAYTMVDGTRRIGRWSPVTSATGS